LLHQKISKLNIEIFKYLTGKGRINLNRFAEIDFMDLGIEWREFKNKI